MSLAQNNNLAHQRKRKLSSCQDCNEPDDNNMVQCDECDKWSHYRCVNVGPEVKDNYWACYRCLVTYKQAKASEKKINNVRCASKPKENLKKPKTSEQCKPWQQVLKEVQDLRSSFQKLVEQKTIKVVEHADPSKDAESTKSIVERAGHNNCVEQIYAELSKTTDRIVENSEIDELAGAIVINECEESVEWSTESIVKSSRFGERDEPLGRERADNCDVQVCKSPKMTDQIVENFEISEEAGALGIIEFEESAESIDKSSQLSERVESLGRDGLSVDGYVLPITRKCHIVAFDDALEDKEVASKQEQSFQRLYAKDYKKMVRMVTERIFTDSFLKDYNFDGQRGKLPLNEYGNVVRLIIDATQKKFLSIEEKTIRNYFMERTKHATERCNTNKQS